MKLKNWKPVLATALSALAVGGVIYYTNWVYIPRMKAQQTVNTISMNNTDSGSSDYEYTIHPENPVTSVKKAEEAVEVEEEKNGDVTIHRTWDKKEEDMNTSVSSPEDTVSTNIASGGDKITGTDGAYHGETPAPATPTPTTNTKPTNPTSTTTTPETSTNTPSNSGDTSNSESTPSSSIPKNGDTRVIDGQEQMYDTVFGWVDCGTGSTTVASAGQYDELSGNQVGEMG